MHSKHNRSISVCLVHTPCLSLRDDRLEPPLGLLYLATMLQQYNYKVKITDLASSTHLDVSQLIPDGFDVYGFSTYSTSYNLTKYIKNKIKARNPQSTFIAGGPHATALPHDVVKDNFDAVIIGEGELAFLNLLKTLEEGSDFSPIITGIPVNHLDALPFPNFDLVDLDSYSRMINGSKCISILTSRGCPYSCAFCNSNIMGKGKKVRYRSAANVVEEISKIKRKYGVHNFRMQDDLFNSNTQRMRELTPLLANEKIQYRCFSRVNTLTAEVAKLLQESGCVHVSLGVESGSSKILSAHAMNKGQTPEQIIAGLMNAHNVGIKIRIYLMVGFPGETDATIQETITLLQNCPWDEFSVYPVIPYPGTPLHDRPQDFGITYINKNYATYFQIGKDFLAGFVMRTATFDEQKVKEWRNYMIKTFLAQGRTWAGDSKQCT